MTGQEHDPGAPESGSLERIQGEHDGSYKRMFSHAAMVEPLLRRFVFKDWVEQLDFSTLEPVKTHFVGPENRRRDSDLVWRLKWGERGAWFYVYLQVEFQSAPEQFMALRALTYLCLLYEELARRKQLTESGRLPPVLPVVLYNGKPRWRKPLELSELIDPVPGPFEAYLPRFRYLLIDEGHLTDEDLAPVDNPVSALFTMEQARSNEDVFRGLEQILKTTGGSLMEPVRKDMLSWILRSLLPVRFPDRNLVELFDLMENPQMLAETVKEWPSQWLAQGHEQGLEEGREQGLEEGREHGLRRAVARQLQLKFGGPTSHFAERLESADETELLTWVERLVVAGTPEDVFKD